MYLKFLIISFFLLFQMKGFSFESERYTGLKEVIEEALLSDPYIKVAAHEFRMGEARREEARGFLLPQVSSHLSSQNANRADNGFKSKVYGNRSSIEVSQVIYDSAAFYNYEKNKINSIKKSFDYDAVRIKRIFDIAEKYLNVIEKNDDVELLKKEIEWNQLNLNKFKKFLEKKMISITDFLSLSANNDILKVSLIDAENELSKSRRDIFEMLGREFLDGLKKVSEKNIINISLSKTLSESIDFALKNNKGFLAKYRELDAAKSEWNESLSEYKPKLNFNLSIQKNTIGYDYTESQKSDVYAANLQLTIPIFSGGSTYQRSKYQRENFLRIEEEVELMRRGIIKNITDTYNDFIYEKNRIEAIRIAFESSRISSLAAEKSFSYGVIDIVEYQGILNNRYKMQSELNNSKYNLLKKYLKLHELMGNIGDQEISYLNSFFIVCDLQKKCEN